MIRNSSLLVALLLPLALAAITAGCGGARETGAPADTSKTAPEAPSPPPAAPAEPAGSSAIGGTVTYQGKIPKLKPLSMDADPGCAAKHTEPVPSEVLVLGEGNTLGNVLVRVTSGLPDREWPTPSEPVVLDQRGCRYIPHVIGVMVNQPFKILNSDGLLHNVHALPQVNKEFNMAMPASRTEALETFNKVEDVFRIKCDVHPWMSAYVAVLGHPYFAVTGQDGRFRITDLPAGTYEIEAWHERLGVRSGSVSVADGEAATFDVTFTM